MSTISVEISDKRLNKLAKKIRPVIRFLNGQRDPNGPLCFIKKVDLRGTAFTWDPKPERIANNLIILKDITTYHSWSYYGFFKPSIAEVLAAIPEDIENKVVAFEIIWWPQDSTDLGKQSAVVNQGFHMATTRLYTSPGLK